MQVAWCSKKKKQKKTKKNTQYLSLPLPGPHLPYLPPPQTHQSPPSPFNTSSSFLPQGLCTCWSLCLDHSPLDLVPPFLLQVSAQSSLDGRTHPHPRDGWSHPYPFLLHHITSFSSLSSIHHHLTLLICFSSSLSASPGRWSRPTWVLLSPQYPVLVSAPSKHPTHICKLTECMLFSTPLN